MSNFWVPLVLYIILPQTSADELRRCHFSWIENNALPMNSQVGNKGYQRVAQERMFVVRCRHASY